MLTILALAVLGAALSGRFFATGQLEPNTSAAASDLSIGPITFEGYHNYAYRDEFTSVQIVLSDTASATDPTRFITAFPKGNTGSLIYFVPSNSSVLGVTLNDTTISGLQDINNQTGVSAHLSISGDLTFGPTLIGSVRTLRDYVESAGTTWHPEFNYTLGTHSNRSVSLIRHWLNGSTVQYLNFNVVDNCLFNVQPGDGRSPPYVSIARIDRSKNSTVRFTSMFNFTDTAPPRPQVPLRGLGVADLFLRPNASAGASISAGAGDAATGGAGNTTDTLTRVLEAIHHNATDVAQQLSFLSYETESLAGGWRFLTCAFAASWRAPLTPDFGRDSLIALRLLMPVLSPAAIEAILAAAIQRTNATTGELCHEETVGDYASFIHLQNNQGELGNTPIYEYTMSDTDFLLLPVLAEYLVSSAGRTRAHAFMRRNSKLVEGSFTSLVQTNADHVIDITRAFADDPSVGNLVPIRAFPFGNWRDSAPGLGWGTYPFDQECALIPAALRAIAQLADAGVLPSNYSEAADAAAVWEEHASGFFEVAISPEAASRALDKYVARANLSDALLYGAGSLNGSVGGAAHIPDADATPGWNAPGQTIGRGPATLYALSLRADGTPVPVLHSDLAFALYYGGARVPPGMLRAAVQALQPYPRGLLTNAGLLVASAAYDANATSARAFDHTAYHGAVAWSWQQALMAAGLARQLELCSGGGGGGEHSTAPAWRADAELPAALRAAQARLWAAIDGTAGVLYTEVWAPVFNASTGRFETGDLGRLSADGTEGDAFQLWSYGFLALVDPRNGRPVAAGLE